MPHNNLPRSEFSTDKLVQSLREKVGRSIQIRCGTMRVLNVDKPIKLDDIYIDINILERITAKRENLEIPKDRASEDFGNFGLSAVRAERVPGLQAVQEYGKLMLLGKPGVGKTTFLKRLAMLCNAGNLYADKVPFFIILREFAEADGSPGLHKYLSEQVKQPVDFEYLAEKGKLFILLDGLDEVREEYTQRIIAEIRKFSEEYPDNTFIVSCRIAATEYVFQQFTDVELADFDDKQVAYFVSNWYQGLNSDKGEIFLQKLKKYPRVRELATNPLLLTMLCLLFNESTDFPANRSELYGQALDELLRKLDGRRKIQRDQVYKKLSLERKKDLLSSLAWKSFDSQEYFFKQEWVEREIIGYIQGLPDAKTDPEALLLDGQAILKSIEAHHGLLVERARSIYSFSHLSFHEYFAARFLANGDDPKAFENLAKHVSDKRWKEVFLLSTEILPPLKVDQLLQAMRVEIGNLVTFQPKLEGFFIWLNCKSLSVKYSYKPAAVRAFYLSLSISCFLAHTRSTDSDLSLNLLGAFTYADKHNLDLFRALDLAISLNFSRALDLACALDPELAHNLAQNSSDILARELKVSEHFLSAMKMIIGELQRLPACKVHEDDFNRWRESYCAEYAKYQEACRVHLDSEFQYEFVEEEILLLRQYIGANRLLVDCMSSEANVTPKAREEIERNLLVENFKG